ncbi:hypothetical protein Nos7524_3753 [Nostoc sp. PCC 7524]|uniref:hypothetical protein n=1 Tax=Nostoc sp. (strain ATCC 29411 / PCC 7524) TaxID=28072 RepID=UPI00029F3AA3|nr:hypothetical protein [Nostoc sp. PCC 7524]AFY49533.1 hypothetical protein Nos7524_3753 [Nostoc sp. PCC 7524]
MMKVLLIDTSLLCVWLKVPGKEIAGNDEWNFELVDKKIQEEINQGTTLVLPLATVIETGNHIAQAKTNTNNKYPTAQKFAEIITYAADETSPWAAFRDQIVLWEAEELKKLASQFPTQAIQETSMGDASIVTLGLYYHHKGFHVEFLTDDDQLKSQEPPPPSPPTRRSSPRKA